MIERLDLFRALAARRTDEIVVMTMTATLQWPLVSRHELDFDFLAFGMGHAGDFGLGLALARPERKTIVLGKVERIETLAGFADALPRLLAEDGPHFVVLPVTTREVLPPVNHSDHAERIRTLRRALGVT